jgi:hypothetical protein
MSLRGPRPYWGDPHARFLDIAAFTEPARATLRLAVQDARDGRTVIIMDGPQQVAAITAPGLGVSAPSEARGGATHGEA